MAVWLRNLKSSCVHTSRHQKHVLYDGRIGPSVHGEQAFGSGQHLKDAVQGFGMKARGVC